MKRKFDPILDAIRYKCTCGKWVVLCSVENMHDENALICECGRKHYVQPIPDQVITNSESWALEDGGQIRWGELTNLDRDENLGERCRYVMKSGDRCRLPLAHMGQHVDESDSFETEWSDERTWAERVEAVLEVVKMAFGLKQECQDEIRWLLDNAPAPIPEPGPMKMTEDLGEVDDSRFAWFAEVFKEAMNEQQQEAGMMRRIPKLETEVAGHTVSIGLHETHLRQIHSDLNGVAEKAHERIEKLEGRVKAIEGRLGEPGTCSSINLTDWGNRGRLLFEALNRLDDVEKRLATQERPNGNPIEQRGGKPEEAAVAVEEVVAGELPLICTRCSKSFRPGVVIRRYCDGEVCPGCAYVLEDQGETVE